MLVLGWLRRLCFSEEDLKREYKLGEGLEGGSGRFGYRAGGIQRNIVLRSVAQEEDVLRTWEYAIQYHELEIYTNRELGG